MKTSYGAAILIRNEAESQNLAMYQKWVPDIQDALPLAAADRPSVRGHVTPMEVMDAPLRAGDLRHGYQAVADNLPERPAHPPGEGHEEDLLQELHGRARQRSHPAARRARDGSGAGQARVGRRRIWRAVVMHEICHGLGPAFAGP